MRGWRWMAVAAAAVVAGCDGGARSVEAAGARGVQGGVEHDHGGTGTPGHAGTPAETRGLPTPLPASGDPCDEPPPEPPPRDPTACGVDEELGTRYPIALAGTTEGAGDGWAGSCGGAGAPERLYRWTAPSDGTYGFSASGALDTVLSVLAEPCAATELACSDDHAGVASYVVRTLAAGETVSVVVDGWGATGGPFALRIGPASEAGSCGDALDGDADGYVDCDDWDCAADAGCAVSAAP